MPDSNEGLGIRLEHLKGQLDDHNKVCDDRHRLIRSDIGSLHGRMDTILSKLDQVVLLDQKINTLAGFAEKTDRTLEGYGDVKLKSEQAHSALTKINWVVLIAVISAILGLIFYKP